MFKNLKNPDNGLLLTMNNITDCIFLSIFAFLCSIPVITLLPAAAALYDATEKALRKGDKNSWKRYLKVFRDNLVTGKLPSLGQLAVDLLFDIIAFSLVFLGIRIWNGFAAGALSGTLFAAGEVFVSLLLGIAFIMPPVLSRFENSPAMLLKNSLLLGLANLPKTLGIGIITAISIFFTLRYVFPLFFLPSLAALLVSFFIEPMFRPFMPDDGQPEAEQD